MLSEELQIYKDTHLLCELLLRYQEHIPRQLRYGEYGKAISLAFEALDLIYLCNADKERRVALLNTLISKVGGVRDRVQLFALARQMQTRQAANTAVVCERVLKQARGWRKAST